MGVSLKTENEETLEVILEAITQAGYVKKPECPALSIGPTLKGGDEWPSEFWGEPTTSVGDPTTSVGDQPQR